MNLNDYENQITEIDNSELTSGEKRHALEMTAEAITGALWQPEARPRAQELATRAFVAAHKHPDGGLESLDALAARGLLAAKL